jgi:hypothetical protein
MKDQSQLKSKLKSSKSKKEQGIKAETGNLSPRGIGSTFAQSVASMHEDAKEISKNKESYLGKEKKTLGPAPYAHSLIKEEKPKA